MEASGTEAVGPPPSDAAIEISETIELPVSLRRLGALVLPTKPGGKADGASRPPGKLGAMHGGFPGGAPDPRTLAPGEGFRHAVTFMGMPTEIAWTVVEWAPFESVALTGAGPMGAQLEFSARIELIEGGVRSHYRLWIGGPALGPMLPAIEPQLRESVAQAQELLRRALAE